MKKIYRKFTYIAPLAFLAGVELANAAGRSIGGETGVGQKLDNPLGKTTTLYQFIGTALEVVMKIGFPVIVLAIIYSGFLYVKAQGNEAKLGEAKTALTYSLVGAAVLLGANVLAKMIEGTINAL